MRVKNLSGNTVTDLGEEAPFLPNYTVVVVNTGTNPDTIQFSNSAEGPFNTAAVIPAGQAAEVVIAGRYCAIENGAGTMILLGN